MQSPIDLDNVDTARDIFYALTDDESLTAHRSAKLLSLICQRLVDTNKLSKDDLDTLVTAALR